MGWGGVGGVEWAEWSEWGGVGGVEWVGLRSLTLMFLPPIITPFIWSSASWAASAVSYSTKA